MRASQATDARMLRILIREVGIREVTNLCAAGCAANARDSVPGTVDADTWNQYGVALSEVADKMTRDL